WLARWTRSHSSLATRLTTALVRAAGAAASSAMAGHPAPRRLRRSCRAARGTGRTARHTRRAPPRPVRTSGSRARSCAAAPRRTDRTLPRAHRPPPQQIAHRGLARFDPVASRHDRAGNDATDPRDVGDPLARVGNGDVAGRGADDLDEGPDPDAGPHGAVMGVKRAHRDGNPD